MFDKILLATDGSDTAKDAARRVAGIQKKFDSTVVIFHAEKHYYVPQEETPRSFPFIDLGLINANMVNEMEEMQQAFKVWGKKMLRETAEIFEKQGLEVETRLITDESPVDYVKEVTKDGAYDLVAVGCKGHHSKLKEIFMGSVATKISNNAYCDVLIVR
ncbi:MAG TPA: universal stress protein [Patescibacteria group bacterium]|nr:universal stress protein [Patescibacteria group bacterium]